MSEYSDKIKLKILKYSLRLEKSASHSLAFIIDIENPKNSKSFGNKSTSLSFNQKLNLLLDSDSIDKKAKEKMEIFMEVRNQFMHNLDIDSFIDAFKSLDGRENRLKKLYPSYFSEEVELEKSYDRVTEKLYLEGIKSLRLFKGVRNNKLKLISEVDVLQRLYESTPKAIDKAIKMLVDDIKSGDIAFSDEEILIKNILLLKTQILTYQQIDEDE